MILKIPFARVCAHGWVYLFGSVFANANRTACWDDADQNMLYVKDDESDYPLLVQYPCAYYLTLGRNVFVCVFVCVTITLGHR